MSTESNLTTLMKSDDDIAQKIARQIANINDAFTSKAITADEATDLLNDMNTDTSLIMLVRDMKAKILIQEIISTLVNAISVIAKI